MKWYIEQVWHQLSCYRFALAAVRHDSTCRNGESSDAGSASQESPHRVWMKEDHASKFMMIQRYLRAVVFIPAFTFKEYPRRPSRDPGEAHQCEARRNGGLSEFYGPYVWCVAIPATEAVTLGAYYTIRSVCWKQNQCLYDHWSRDCRVMSSGKSTAVFIISSVAVMTHVLQSMIAWRMQGYVFFFRCLFEVNQAIGNQAPSYIR